jgi:hypothetical protein
MWATEPRGCETNPLRGGQVDLGCYWHLSNLEHVICRSLATLNAKSGFFDVGGLEVGIASPRRPKRRMEFSEHRFLHGTRRYYQIAVRLERVVGQ